MLFSLVFLRVGKDRDSRENKNNFFPRKETLSALLHIQRMNKIKKKTINQTNKQHKFTLLNTANVRQIHHKIRKSLNLKKNRLITYNFSISSFDKVK